MSQSLQTENRSDVPNYLTTHNTLGGRVGFFAGDADDVLRRFVDAAIKNEIDVVVRVTGDNPLVSHEWIDRLVESHFEIGADYSCLDDPTLGLGSEVMNVSSMKRILDHFGGAPHSEYMTWYFTNNPDRFSINRLKVEPKENRQYRLTLDYDEDLLLFRNVFERLGQPTEAVSMADIYRVLDDNPDLPKINLHRTPVYRSNNQLIAMLNAETKF
jgi:spore coat polysaccharide biosynthesis protein SpsF (cytidylyltransferase family)